MPNYLLVQKRHYSPQSPDYSAISAHGHVDSVPHNRISLRLGNGSRIVGLPGSKAAVPLLIIDEAPRPMLAVSNGAL